MASLSGGLKKFGFSPDEGEAVRKLAAELKEQGSVDPIGDAIREMIAGVQSEKEEILKQVEKKRGTQDGDDDKA